MMKRNPQMPLILAILVAIVLVAPAHAADKSIKVFVLAGQSNMVGWGDSTKLPDDLGNGHFWNKRWIGEGNPDSYSRGHLGPKIGEFLVRAYLVRTISDARAFDRLSSLAEALKDAGCDDKDILSHCHSKGPHAKGCWVVDLLLDEP